jgi:hypothetical protein
MEGFPAIDIEQFRYIKKVIDQCDYYVLIVGGRYGSVAQDGVSFTEKEYHYAVETGKVVIAFVLDPSAASKLPASKVDALPDVVARLARFKNDVMTGRLVRPWTDQNSLSKAVMKSLIAAFDEFPGVGWVRASVQASEDVLAQINELRIRNDDLENENEKLRKQLSPQIENLVPLDSEYNIKYTYYSRHSTRESSSVTLKWREIFVAIAPNLSLPQAPVQLANYLEAYLRAANLSKGRSPDINPICANQIRVQLEAFGLIEGVQGKNVKGGLGEWVQITELGRRVMLEAMVLRSPDGTGTTP